ncbi:hypothetical protein BJV77DRAFT_1074189 [Russula vinacea]|nr:hypothetical protein BJV77DRAFT_1074189 [Russula vinacea]
MYTRTAFPLPSAPTTAPASRTLKPRAFTSAIQTKEHYLTSTTTTTTMPPDTPPVPGIPRITVVAVVVVIVTAFPPLSSSSAPTNAHAFPLALTDVGTP